MVKTADKSQSAEWDFPVFQEELNTRAGNPSGIHAVIRGDTGAVIGQYKGEKLLKNTELLGAVESELSRLGLSFNRNIITTSGGARMFADYSIGDLTVNGERFKQRLEIGNSYDGSMMKTKSFYGERVLCLNSMIGMGEIAGARRKHSLDIDVEAWVSDIGPTIEQGAIAFGNRIKLLSDVAIDTGKAQNILSNLVEMSHGQGISERSAILINHNWRNPSADEVSLGDTLYRLYNAGTRFTREVAKVGRFELSHKSAVYIAGAFDFAISRGQLNKLIEAPAKPIDFDSVTVN